MAETTRAPNVHGRLAADAIETAILYKPEQFCLKRHWHVTDLVQEQSAFSGPFGVSEMPLLRPGKRAFFVTENLAFQEFGRDRAQFTAMNGSAPR